MAPHLQIRDFAMPSDTKPTLGPSYIVGIVIIVIVFIGAAAWWGKKVLAARKLMKEDESKRRRLSMANREKTANEPSGTGKPLPPNGFSREKITPAIVLPKRRTEDAEPIVRLPPPRPQATSRPESLQPLADHRNSSNPSLRRPTGLRTSFVPGPNNRMSCASMSAQEIIDHHMTSGNFPAAFAPLALGDFGTFGPSVDNAIAASMSSAKGEKEADRDSFLNLDDEKEKRGHKPSFSFGKFPGRHSRFSSLGASFRQSVSTLSFPGGSPTRSIFQFGGKHSSGSSAPGGLTPENLAAMSTDQRIVQITFSPLLPDELVLTQFEKVTVLESFDDGWCICARTHLGMLEVGAIPEHCFTGGQQDRPMRSSSLGVTVDLRIVEEVESGGRPGFGGRNVRDSVMSWSNF